MGRSLPSIRRLLRTAFIEAFCAPLRPPYPSWASGVTSCLTSLLQKSTRTAVRQIARRASKMSGAEESNRATIGRKIQPTLPSLPPYPPPPSSLPFLTNNAECRVTCPPLPPLDLCSTPGYDSRSYMTGDYPVREIRHFPARAPFENSYRFSKLPFDPHSPIPRKMPSFSLRSKLGVADGPSLSPFFPLRPLLLLDKTE